MDTTADPASAYRKAWADIIRAKRCALGMGTAELAKRIGVSTSAVSNWEHRYAAPGPRAQRALVRELGIADNELARIYRGNAA